MAEDTDLRPVVELSPDFNPPPPLHIYTAPPLLRSVKEAKEYYVEQEYPRWINGYNGLTGPHYFYIQECFLKDIDGNIFHPEWRQVDHEDVFKNVQECMDLGEGLMVVKPRDMGLTSIFAGGLPFYFARINPGCLINMTSKDKDAFVRMFDDKVMTTFENVSPYVLNREPLNKNNTKDQAYLKLSVKKLLEDGSERAHTTTINVVETSENPRSVTKFSGGRAKYTFIDESGLHRRIRSLLQSLEATMQRGMDRKGFVCLGGTLEAALTNEQIIAYNNLLSDVKAFKIRTVFIPAYKTLAMKNGWYDKDTATKWVMGRREDKAKSSDPSDLRAEIMTYPLCIDDIFQFSKGGYFEEDVENILNRRLEEVSSDPEPKVKLYPYNGTVEAKPDSGGMFIQLEAPKPGIIYYQAIDSIGGGTEDGAKEGSKIASIIFKGFDPDGGTYMPVSIYLERPKTVEDGYRNIVNQIRHYNKYGQFKETNYETNIGTGDHFGTFLKKEGLYQYAGGRFDYSGKGYVNTKKKGQAVNEHAMEWLVPQANMFLRRFGHLIPSPTLILDLLKPALENADLRSAFLMFMISVRDYDKPLKVKQKRKTMEVTRLVKEGKYNVWKSYQVNLDDTDRQGNDALQNFINSVTQQHGAEWYNQLLRDEKLKSQYDTLLAQCSRN